MAMRQVGDHYEWFDAGDGQGPPPLLSDNSGYGSGPYGNGPTSLTSGPTAGAGYYGNGPTNPETYGPIGGNNYDTTKSYHADRSQADAPAGANPNGYWGTDENGGPVWRNQAYSDPNAGGGAVATKSIDDQIAALLQSIVDSNNKRFDEQNRQFNSGQYAGIAQNLLNGATQLTGPADYFKFLKYSGGGQDILKSLYGDQARPAFAGPTGENQALTIQDVLNRLGLGANPTPTPAPQVSVQSTPGENTSDRFFVPPPNQVNPGVWDSLGNTGQQFVMGAVQAAGWDPNEFLSQLNATRPKGNASRMPTTSFAAPQSAYGGAF